MSETMPIGGKYGRRGPRREVPERTDMSAFQHAVNRKITSGQPEAQKQRAARTRLRRISLDRVLDEMDAELSHE